MLHMLSEHLAIVIPDDVAQEKVQALQALGADVNRVRPASIVDKKQFVVNIMLVTFIPH